MSNERRLPTKQRQHIAGTTVANNSKLIFTKKEIEESIIAKTMEYADPELNKNLIQLMGSSSSLRIFAKAIAETIYEFRSSLQRYKLENKMDDTITEVKNIMNRT